LFGASPLKAQNDKIFLYGGHCPPGYAYVRQTHLLCFQEGGHDSEEFGVIPAKQRVERKERSRLKQVKFSHDRPSLIDSKVSVCVTIGKRNFARRSLTRFWTTVAVRLGVTHERRRKWV